MANAQKGEVDFTVGESTYTLNLGHNAFALIEAKANMPWLKFFRRPEDQWTAKDTITVFWAGLQRHHQISEDEVGDLLDEMSSDTVKSVLVQAFGLSIGKEGAKGTARPPRGAAKNGTGTAS